MFKLNLRGRKANPEEQKWLEDLEDEVLPYLEEFKESPEYKGFMKGAIVDLVVFGNDTYSEKELQKVIKKYHARVNAN